MALPNFIIIGAAKSGTTSIYHYLKQHPQIFMCPIKEPNFFSSNPCNYTIKEYENLYKGTIDEKAIGEASPSYLRSYETPMKIKQLIPHCKIIIILRNPMERLFSDFNYSKCLGVNRGNVDDFLRKQVKNNKGSWYSLGIMIKTGMYYDQVKRYIQVFGREKIKINLYEELISKSQQFILDIYKFLEVNSSFFPNIEKIYNVGSKPIIPKLSEFIGNPPAIIKNFFKFLLPMEYIKQKQLIKRILWFNVRSQKSLMSNETKSYLLKIYHEDILNLEQLIGKDLSDWLKCRELSNCNWYMK